MKKCKKWLIALIICAFMGIIVFIIPRGKIELSSNVVDNDYNNFVAGGNLVRINDTLFYNYNCSINRYGLVKIDESGSNRIFWKGPFYYNYLGYTLPIRKYRDVLLMGEGENIYYYDVEKQDFLLYDLVSNIPNIGLNFELYEDVIIYQWRDMYFPVCGGSLYKYSKGDRITQYIVRGGLDFSFSYGQDGVFYIEYQGINDSDYFVKYNVEKNESCIVYEIKSEYRFYSFLMEESKVVFYGYHNDNLGFYLLDLSGEVMDIEEIYELDVPANSGWNMYDNKIYIPTDNALLVCEIETRNVATLCSMYSEECYILDDTWIYFVGDRKTLWRITQDGQDIEKVYGW